MPFRAFLLLTLVCLLWGANVIVSKLVIEDLGMPPIFYSAMRSLLVLAVLFPWLRPLPLNWKKIALLAFAVSGGSFSLLYIGLMDASPSSAAIVSLAGAPLTVLFAIVILKERIGLPRAVGIALALGGVGLAIASPSAWEASTGLAFVFASAMVGAAGSIFLKQIDFDPLRLQAWAALSSSIALFPLSFVMETGQIPAMTAQPWDFALALAFSSLVVSIFAHTAYFRLLRQYDANVIAPLTLMNPMFTILLGVLITGDEVGFHLLAGAAISGAGVLVILIRPSRKIFKPLLVRPRL